MIGREISVNEVEEGVEKGAKELQYPNKLLFHFRDYTVVAKKIKDDYFIITVEPRW